ncbi:MAG: hypothetical protein LBI02_06270 [Opitutaceae bacterium]|jgi:hypothetical protein|nr:hypothetical protein [Opitutaceae bacterium]
MPTAEAPVVEMEPYVVRDERILPNPEAWFYIKIPALESTRGGSVVVVPGYEILTPSRARKNARVFAGELQLRQLAGALLFPDVVRALPRSAIVLIWDDEGRLRARSGMAWHGDSIFTADAFKHAGRLPDPRYAVGTLRRAFGNQITDRASRYDDDAGRVTMGTDDIQPRDDGLADAAFDEKRLSAILAMNGGPLTVYVDTPYEGALIDGAARSVWINLNNYALGSAFKNIPEWLTEGLSCLYATVQVTPRQIDFGKADFGIPRPMGARSSSSMTAPSPLSDGTPRPMPPPNNPIVSMPKLADVLKGGDRPLDARHRQYKRQFAAAFVHYCLYGGDGKYTENFFQFVERLQDDLFSEELFKACFGKTVTTFRAYLTDYARSFAYYKSTQYRGKFTPMPALTLREATQSEVARLKAEVLIAQGWVPNALDELRIAYWRGERDPWMLALLALLEEHIGSISRAEKITKTLLASPQVPARAPVVAAKLRLRELGAGAPGREKLNKDEADSVMEHIIKAREQGLLNEDLCATLAKLVYASEEPPDASITGFLTEAAKRYPLNQALSAALKTGAPQAHESPGIQPVRRHHARP